MRPPVLESKVTLIAKATSVYQTIELLSHCWCQVVVPMNVRQQFLVCWTHLAVFVLVQVQADFAKPSLAPTALNRVKHDLIAEVTQHGFLVQLLNVLNLATFFVPIHANGGLMQKRINSSMSSRFKETAAQP